MTMRRLQVKETLREVLEQKLSLTRDESLAPNGKVRA